MVADVDETSRRPGAAAATGHDLLVLFPSYFYNDVYVSIARAIGMNVTTIGRAAWCKGPAIT